MTLIQVVLRDNGNLDTTGTFEPEAGPISPHNLLDIPSNPVEDLENTGYSTYARDFGVWFPKPEDTLLVPDSEASSNGDSGDSKFSSLLGCSPPRSLSFRLLSMNMRLNR